MFNLVWIGYSFLLTLSFFTLIIWFVVNTAIKKNSFAFKLRTMSAVLTIGTIIVAILYAIDITFADIFIGYGLGIIALMIIDHYYFTPVLTKSLTAQLLTKIKKIQNETEQPESEPNSHDPPDT